MSEKSTHWADQIADQAAAKHKKNIVCTGITPSGQIHIGNMREVLTGDAVYRALLDKNQAAEFLYIADSFDSLRKVYPFLDEKIYSDMVGKPISDIPGPGNDEKTYSEYFLEPFLKAVKELGLNVKVLRADQMYKEGLYADAIITALEKRDEIAKILTDQTGKEIKEDWSPVNPICSACGRMTGTCVTGFSAKDKTVDYTCECGHKGTADTKTGGVKLTWRVDWPARWSILGVTVEPFGKDHASRGGSYDTGRLISRQIYNYDPPVPITYEWISLKGRGDMSSSKGNVISISDMLEVVPPDVLRYMIFRTKPKKAISFDPGLPLLSLVDELDDSENKNKDKRAFELSLVSDFGEVGVPFKHLVNIIQVAFQNEDDAIKIIERGGYKIKDENALKRRLNYAKKWLKNYAPPEMLFSPLEELPTEASQISDSVKTALKFLADNLTDTMTGEEIHTLFYKARDSAGIEPKELFHAVYLTLIGKDRGPRAGWFIETLGMDFVKKRFFEASK